MLSQFEVIGVDDSARKIEIREIPERDRQPLPASRNLAADGWLYAPGYQPSQALIDALAELEAYRAGLADGTIQRRTLTEDEEMLRDHMLNG